MTGVDKSSGSNLFGRLLNPCSFDLERIPSWSGSFFLFFFAFTFAFTFCLPCLSFAGENLIPNPEFIAPADDPLSPHFWHRGESDVKGVRKSEFSVGMAGSPPVRSLGIKGGEDRQGEWWCTATGLERGRRYLFSFKAYRERFDEGAYPEVEVFGTRLRLSNHLTTGGWQVFSRIVTAPSDTTVIRFINNAPVQFYFSSPVLRAVPGDNDVVMPSGVFPLVAYGGREGNLDMVRDIGFNGVVAAASPSNVEGLVAGLRKHGLSLVAQASDAGVMRRLAGEKSLLGWYVEDEPEGRSVPLEKILDLVRQIRGAGSRHPAFIAMVRPEFAGYYREAADVLLMDQYPIPHQPLTWLSRSMDDAWRAGPGAVWAVIQIFGGKGYEGTGWTRRPTYEEMRALSYLAIVHGAKGLFFYTAGEFDKKDADPAHRADVKRLVQELRYLTPQFLAEGLALQFRPDPLYEFAHDGSRPVHALMLRDGMRTHVIAVNVLDKPVSGRITGLDDRLGPLDEFFSGRRHVIRDGNIADSFRPFEVKVYTAGKRFRDIRVVGRADQSVKADLYAEIAETALDWMVGLMFRDLASEDRALVFQGRDLGGSAFYALNVRKPFDMIVADKGGIITVVHKDIPPCADEHRCALYLPPPGSSIVIEVKAGLIDKKKIRTGDRIEFR